MYRAKLPRVCCRSRRSPTATGSTNQLSGSFSASIRWDHHPSRAVRNTLFPFPATKHGTANSREPRHGMYDRQKNCSVNSRYRSYRPSIHFVEGDLTANIGAAKHDHNARTVRLLDNTTVPEVLRPKGITTVNCETDLHFENGASIIFHIQPLSCHDRKLHQQAVGVQPSFKHCR